MLPICSKIFEGNNYVIDNNLISYKREDCYINQLISITHDIFNSLDESLEVRGVFLDISKAFNKVWHEQLIYKSQQNVISDDVKAGVPQDSIMGHLIYINNLPEGLNTNAKLIADETSILSIVRDFAGSTQELSNDPIKISKWAYQ